MGMPYVKFPNYQEKYYDIKQILLSYNTFQLQFLLPPLLTYLPSPSFRCISPLFPHQKITELPACPSNSSKQDKRKFISLY